METIVIAGYDRMVGTQFGRYLARERLARGMTQTDLAARSGIGISTVAQLEQGRKTRPTKDTLRKLAGALGLRYIDLLVGAGEVDASDIGLAPADADEKARLYALVRALDPAHAPAVEAFIVTLTRDARSR